MRTTLTLDPDVVALLQDAAHQSRATFKDVVNDAIRKGLGKAAPQKPFKVNAWPLGIPAGVDRGRYNQLVDEMDIAEFVEAQSRRRK